MEELNQIRLSLGVHVVVALLMGWLSFIIAEATRSLYAIGLGLVVLYVVGFAVQKVTGKKGIKWWAGNGLIIYLFFWLIGWTVFFSMA